MQRRIGSLLAKATELSPQFKSLNLQDFVVRRTRDRLNHIEKLAPEKQEEEVKKVEEFLKVIERQLPIQNMFHSEKSVLES